MQDINSPKGRTLLFITRRYKLKFQAFYTVNIYSYIILKLVNMFTCITHNAVELDFSKYWYLVKYI